MASTFECGGCTEGWHQLLNMAHYLKILVIDRYNTSLDLRYQGVDFNEKKLSTIFLLIF
jgi:hypothetical protein